MKSLAVDNKGGLSVTEIDMPEYGDYKALVKMESCGVCNGTDLKLIHGNFKGFDTYPAILGHEGVGRVVEKGKKVKSFDIGDLVLLPFLEEKSGDYYPGWGAFSEYAVIGDWKAIAENEDGAGCAQFSEAYYAQQIVPTSIDPVNASMIITFREVLSAMRRFQMESNKSIVIFGAGPVGICFTRFAKLLGMGPVITIDIQDAKIAEAASMGADHVFNSTGVNVSEEVKKICPDGVDFVVDAVGFNALINTAMEIIKYNGKICCYGISPKLSMELDWSKAPYNWTLQFVQWPSKFEESEAHRQILNWINLGVLNPGDFISDVISFENILEAFKMVEERKAKKKIVVRF